jgi:hypothetical protein
VVVEGCFSRLVVLRVADAEGLVAAAVHGRIAGLHPARVVHGTLVDEVEAEHRTVPLRDPIHRGFPVLAVEGVVA